MSSDLNILGKALKNIGILVLLFIASPILFTIAFKAIKIYTEGIEYYLSRIFLMFAASLIVFTIFFGIRTFSLISKAIFDK